ncbi:MAG: PaaI family thioesterase [Betaproteobacteria bacterium]|nr:PaaI family thioesterase [Betaproteobacteria bacterium]
MAPAMSLEEFAQFWDKSEYVSPYNRELGLQPHSVRPDWCVLKVEYARNLVGDPNTRVLHGGVITALLDAAFGFSIFVKMSQVRLMATLDLRIDYLKPATPDKAVLGGAVCYKMTADLAFVRGCAYHESADDPIATAVGIFMFTDGPTLIRDEGVAR